jgi:adenylate kinase family enzyme
MPPLPRHYLITGAPGAGKTTYAKAFAEQRGLPLVSVDGLQAEDAQAYPDTQTLAAYLEEETEPSVIEGAQVLGLSDEVLARHNVMLLEANKRTLLKRLARRGLVDEGGVRHVGTQDPYIQRSVDEFTKEVVPGFKKRVVLGPGSAVIPGVKLKSTGK